MCNEPDILARDNLGEPMSHIASRLVAVLGSRLCAVIGDVKQTRSVREWMDGLEPTIGRARTLRFALRVAVTIQQRYGSVAAQAWFQGANRALSDESPALVLKRASVGGEGKVLAAEQIVTHALRIFLDT
jgi:hypothetical protein